MGGSYGGGVCIDGLLASSSSKVKSGIGSGMHGNFGVVGCSGAVAKRGANSMSGVNASDCCPPVAKPAVVSAFTYMKM